MKTKQETRQAMKKALKLSICIAIILIEISCVKYKQNKGFISPKSDEVTLDFSTARNLVILPVNLDGTLKYFAIDSGDELTTINRKEPKGKVKKVGTATGEKAKVGQEIVKSMIMGEMELKNICAQNLNFEYIEKEVPNYGGLIGQSILSKANWMIDYPNKKVKISTKEINTDGFETIAMKKIRDPYIDVVIDRITYKAFVDLGSSTAFSVLESSDLGKKLSTKITFVEESKETFTASGVNTSIVKRGILPTIKVGNIELNNTNMILTKKSSAEIRIGMSFFKDCMLYLDYKNGNYKFKKVI
jgi:hypothetical protein